MSVITSIIQAILQSIAWIFPISESGHSAIFHDFAGRADGSVAALTGIIHIGIALGIVASCFKVYKMLGVEFVTSGIDIVKRNFSVKRAKPPRQFMFYTLITYAFMLLWLIPLGDAGFLYNVLRSSGFNKTLFEDGIFIAVTGAITFLCARQLSLSRNDKQMSLLPAVVCGISSLVLVPVSGFSFTGGILAILIFMSVKKSIAFKYTFALCAPVLLVMGIIEICVAAVPVSAVQIILGLIFSVAASFICVRTLKWVINKGYLKYVSYYTAALGIIITVVGIVQLIVR
ncbi:MAG: undecaprenyl-diphosphate phosphatase [Eubacterium sp.]|nr:undecaprenyl-diphosphate phosphatase [Eubacterium sp.]